MIPARWLPSARRKSARACSALAFAESRSRSSACIEASLPRAMARGFTWSICSRNCPLRTRSPSLTARRVIWPAINADTSTRFCACTLPLAVTFACRSSRPTFATSTGVASPPRPSSTQPPSSSASPTIPSSQTILLRPIATPVSSPRYRRRPTACGACPVPYPRHLAAPGGAKRRQALPRAPAPPPPASPLGAYCSYVRQPGELRGAAATALPQPSARRRPLGPHRLGASRAQRHRRRRACRRQLAGGPHDDAGAHVAGGEDTRRLGREALAREGVEQAQRLGGGPCPAQLGDPGAAREVAARVGEPAAAARRAAERRDAGPGAELAGERGDPRVQQRVCRLRLQPHQLREGLAAPLARRRQRRRHVLVARSEQLAVLAPERPEQRRKPLLPLGRDQQPPGRRPRRLVDAHPQALRFGGGRQQVDAGAARRDARRRAHLRV